MIKEWRIEGDEYVWTGNWTEYSRKNLVYCGKVPVGYLIKDPDNEYDTAPQNASTTHEVATGSDKTP